MKVAQTSHPTQQNQEIFSWAANYQVVGKNGHKELSYAGAWSRATGTLEDLAEHIGKGHPWMPALLGGAGERWQHNASYAELLALDIDSGMTIAEAIAHPLSKYMGLGIESASSTEEHNKFRGVFALPEVILGGSSNECFLLPRGIYQELRQAAGECADLAELSLKVSDAYEQHRSDEPSPSADKGIASILQRVDWDKAARLRHLKAWETIRIANRYLAEVWGSADPACKDASRFFFGAEGKIAFLIQNTMLFGDFIDRAIAWHLELEAAAQAERERRKAWLDTQDLGDQAEMARQALGYIPAYSPGNGTYNDLITMAAGVVNDLGADGVALLEAWDGFGRETSKKVQGLDRTPNKKATLGTLFKMAKEYGWKRPRKEFTSEEKRAYAQQKAAERKAALPAIGILEELKKGLGQIATAIADGFDKTVKAAKAAPKKAPEKEIYIPGSLPQQAAGVKLPIYIYDRDQLESLLAEASRKGWRDILDTSPTGTGKSTTYAQVDYGKMGFHHTWWIATNHRNPSTAEVEQYFTDMPVRHAGMELDNDRLTPLGNPRQTIAKDGTAGNCHLAAAFHLAAKQGFQDAESSEGGLSPICQGCKFRDECGSNPFGIGSGYRAEKRRHLSHVKSHRSHLDSVPASADHSQSIAILDEDQLDLVRTVSPTASAIALAWNDLEIKDTEAYDSLRPLKLALGKLMASDEKLFHGRNHEAVMALLPQAPEDLSLVRRAGEAIVTTLDKVVAGFNGIEEVSAQLKVWPSQWLADFLGVWAGTQQGAIRITPFGELQLSLYKDHQNNILNRMAVRVQLDATGDRAVYALKRQITVDSVLQVEMAFEAPNNLRVVQVTGMGLLGKNRSADSDRRVAAILKKISPTVIFDFLGKKTDTGADGHWFSDHTRGTNDYAGATTIVAIGIPLVNFGAMEDEWLTLRGAAHGVSLQDFYKQKIDAEVIQMIGRNRSNRHPDQKFTVYILGDSENCLNLDYKVPEKFNPETLQAKEICLEAGSRWDLFFAAAQAAIETLRVEGRKVTQGAIANLCNCSQQYISKVWEKIQLALLDSLNSTGCENLEAIVEAEKEATEQALLGVISPLQWLSILYQRWKESIPVPDLSNSEENTSIEYVFSYQEPEFLEDPAF